MTRTRRALIVVDVQQEYFEGLLPIQFPPREESVQRIAAAMKAAAAADVPVVVVQHSAGEQAPVFNPTSPMYALHPAVEDLRDPSWKTVVKQFGSVFAGTDLESWLSEQQIDTVTLVGYMTNNCILASAVEAEVRGLSVEVLSDATGAIGLANAAGSSDARTVHETLLALLNSNFAAVTSCEDWMQAVENGNPSPKSNLVESAAAARISAL